MIVALASSGVVSSQRFLGSSLDWGSILLLRTLLQRMLQTLVLWCTFCYWTRVLPFGPHWTGWWCLCHGLCCPFHRWTHHHVWPILWGIGPQCHPSCIWKISWDIFSPKGTCKNLYLLRWVLNVIRSDASSVRCILKKALLPSTFENLVAPVRTWAISSRVGALWFSRMIALFRSLGSRQILSLPFAFFGYIRLLTHGVGSVCLVMILWQTISANSFSISSLYSMGTFHLPC